MVSSMTGYGRARGEKGGMDLTVELKSVNSRYFEYSSRMPRSFAFMEDRLKKLVNEKVARGKLELCVSVVNLSEQEYIMSVRSSVNKSPKVFLKREPSEVRINGFNADVLELFQANMDIQFILDPYACVHYI